VETRILKIPLKAVTEGGPGQIMLIIGVRMFERRSVRKGKNTQVQGENKSLKSP